MVSIKEFPRGILDQVISGKNSTECKTRAPGPGLKLRHGGLTPEASGSKRQAIEESVPYTDVIEAEASSTKLQAPSVKLSNQPVQASSGKRQAPGSKLQASSHKLQAP